MNWSRWMVLLAVVVLVIPRATSEEPKKPEFDMRQKLDFSKTILDGLVTEDFEKILKGAEALTELGKHNWMKNQSVDYRTQNQVFWFTAKALIASAKNKSIDGATLAYTQVVHSCVNCHKLIRLH